MSFIFHKEQVPLLPKESNKLCGIAQSPSAVETSVSMSCWVTFMTGSSAMFAQDKLQPRICVLSLT